MKTFALTVLGSETVVTFDNVTQCIAADASGAFGILAGHQSMLAVLRYGLARFADTAGVWHYLAMPGGVLRFADNRLTVTTVRFFLGEEREALVEQLAKEMARVNSDIQVSRASLIEIEHLIMRRLAELGETARETTGL